MTSCPRNVPPFFWQFNLTIFFPFSHCANQSSQLVTSIRKFFFFNLFSFQPPHSSKTFLFYYLSNNVFFFFSCLLNNNLWLWCLHKIWRFPSPPFTVLWFAFCVITTFLCTKAVARLKTSSTRIHTTETEKSLQRQQAETWSEWISASLSSTTLNLSCSTTEWLLVCSFSLVFFLSLLSLI